MKKNFLLLTAIMTLLLSSCHTPNLAYFEDVRDGSSRTVQERNDVRFRVGDKLTIVVNSRDPQLSSLFNLPYITHTIGASTSDASGTSSAGNGVLGYTIDSKGEIDFPVLGKVRLAGLKREEVASLIKKELVTRNLVNDPVVTVDYAGLPFNVMGEVARPGRYYFDRDHMTLLDALSMAGDLTINGKRENVMVIREVGDARVTYRVDLQSASQLYASPAYYLQQNDIVYVEPTRKREREATASGNILYTPTFWLSISSLLLTVGVLIFK